MLDFCHVNILLANMSNLTMREFYKSNSDKRQYIKIFDVFLERTEMLKE